MIAFPAHPAWDFVTHLYGAPGVAPACLDMQERHGIDVTFMLFCLWRGSASNQPVGEHMPVLVAVAREWHETIVLPVRAARRRLKAAAAASQKPDAAALYKKVLAAEVDCEHAELLMLAERAHTLCGAADGGGTPAVMAANLDTFFETSGVTPTAQDRPAVAAILQAVRAAEAAARLTFPESGPAA